MVPMKHKLYLFRGEYFYFKKIDPPYCYTVGWVDIGIGTKGKWGFVVSLEKGWEIAIKVSLIN
jgi:hypothetical protein